MARINYALNLLTWEDHEEQGSLCQACYLVDGKIVTRDVLDCRCGREDCQLVWCSEPDRSAADFVCAELHYLHIHHPADPGEEWDIFSQEDMPRIRELVRGKEVVTV